MRRAGWRARACRAIAGTLDTTRGPARVLELPRSWGLAGRRATHRVATRARDPPLPGAKRPRPAVAADAARLPFTDSSFDAVVGVETLLRARDADAAVREWVRCVRPGGSLFLVERDGRRAFVRARGLLRLVLGRGGLARTLRAAAALLEAQGLSCRLRLLDRGRWLLEGRRR